MAGTLATSRWRDMKDVLVNGSKELYDFMCNNQWMIASWQSLSVVLDPRDVDFIAPYTAAEDLTSVRSRGQNPGLFVLWYPDCSVEAVLFAVRMEWVQVSTVLTWLSGAYGPIHLEKLRALLDCKKILSGLASHVASPYGGYPTYAGVSNALGYLSASKQCAVVDLLLEKVFGPNGPDERMLCTSTPSVVGDKCVSVTRWCPHCLHRLFPRVFPGLLDPSGVLEAMMRFVFEKLGHDDMNCVIDVLLSASGELYAGGVVERFLRANYKPEHLHDLYASTLQRRRPDRMKPNCSDGLWNMLDRIRSVAGDAIRVGLPYKDMLSSLGFEVMLQGVRSKRAIPHIDVGENDNMVKNDHITSMPELLLLVNNRKHVVGASVSNTPLLLKCVFNLQESLRVSASLADKLLVAKGAAYITDLVDKISDRYYTFVTQSPLLLRNIIAVSRDKDDEFPLVARMYKRMRSNMAKLLLLGAYSPQSQLLRAGPSYVQLVVDTMMPRPEEANLRPLPKKDKQ